MRAYIFLGGPSPEITTLKSCDEVVVAIPAVVETEKARSYLQMLQELAPKSTVATVILPKSGGKIMESQVLDYLSEYKGDIRVHLATIINHRS